jgi:hypothetical protein
MYTSVNSLVHSFVAKFCEAPRISARLDTIFLNEMKERHLHHGGEASVRLPHALVL